MKSMGTLRFCVRSGISDVSFVLRAKGRHSPVAETRLAKAT